MKNKKKFKFKLYYIFVPFIVILLAVGIVVDCLYPMYSQVIHGALGAEARADDEYVEAALENSKEVNIKLEEEGAVLLKNEDESGEPVLPIDTSKTSKVNVYGILSAHHYSGGTGSGGSSAVAVDLKTALASVSLSVDEDIWKLISDAELKLPDASEVGAAIAGQYELELTKYTAVKSFAAAYSNSNYAILTLGTNGGEGSDGDRSESSNSLQFGENEQKLLAALDEAGFKVIVLINSSYVMELGPVLDHADAVLWIGGTGIYGMYGVANLLVGNANPSGRLVDTWMYDQKTSSTYYTTDDLKGTNEVDGNDGDAEYYDASGKKLGSYTNYNEGIYIGYKWYETADAENYWNGVSNKYGNGYEGVVAFPFGYGLSYTTFDEQITDATYDNGTFTFTISATNTGAVEGKDVIELYVEKPYTNGGVEVSKVELVGFDKSDVLATSGDNATQEFTITVEEEDLASYDTTADNGNGCYVLAGGEYKFYLASATTGAHIWASASGDETRARSFTVAKKEYSALADGKRSSDAVTATNQLETTDNDSGVSIADTSAGFNELSRANGFANASATISAAANVNGKVVLAEDNPLYQALKDNYGSGQYSNYNTDHLSSVAETTNTAVEQKKVYTLADLYTTDADGNPLYEIDEETGVKTILKEVDYDDSRWEALISQMSLDEMAELIGNGGYGTVAVSSIGKISTYEYDGPTGINNYLKASIGRDQDTTGFCSEPIMAATWNTELLEEYGRAVGKEANAFSVAGWYAPGMNIHRTPFEGRTGEYFSEDSFITGMMGAAVATGAFSVGLYTYAKHFAFNEIEANRENGMNVNMSEQVAREVYLRPFEIAIKKGALTGMMSSFMYVNGMHNSANYNLMSGIVRGEWNFKGVINTDLCGAARNGAEKSLCAGGVDLMLTTSYAMNAASAYLRCDTIKKTSEGICAMKTAVKHILYANASAALHREVQAEESDLTLVTVLLVTLNIVGFGGAAVLLGLFTWRLVLDIKRGASKVTVLDEDESSDGSSPKDES